MALIHAYGQQDDPQYPNNEMDNQPPAVDPLLDGAAAAAAPNREDDSNNLPADELPSPIFKAVAEVKQGFAEDCFVFECKNQLRESFDTLYEFQQQGTLCDVILKVGSKSVAAHRSVLACGSHYFRAMFSSEMAESHQSEVEIKEMDETAVESLIIFCYTARLQLTVENVERLLFASSILQMEAAAAACSEFMAAHLQPANCLGVHGIAKLHNRSRLLATVTDYIADHFADVVANGDEFCAIDADHLLEIIGSESLQVEDERLVFEAVIKWVKWNIAEREGHLPTLMSRVHLPVLPTAYLMQIVANEPLMKHNLACRDLVDEAKNHQLARLQGFAGDLSRLGGHSGVGAARTAPHGDDDGTEAAAAWRRTRPRNSCAGALVCIGGRGGTGDPYRSIECYDLRQDRWFSVSDMATRRRHVGVCSIDNMVYAVGGHDGKNHLNSVEVYNANTNSWRTLAAMATFRRGIAVVSLGGVVYAIGGLDDQRCFSFVERYDRNADRWSDAEKMNQPRGGVCAASVGSYVYVCGGNDGSTSLATCERYDPHLDQWTVLPKMNHRRAGAGLTVLNGCLYVMGGFDDNAPLASLECLHVSGTAEVDGGEWQLLQPMTTKRGGVGVCTCAGKIYAVGGHDGNTYLKSVECYDPITDRWEAVSNISVCRAGAGLAWVDVPIKALLPATDKTNEWNMGVAASCV